MTWRHLRPANATSRVLGIIVFAMVLTASAIIGGSWLWASRNGTLHESDQERVDRLFDEMIIAERYRS